MGVDLMQHLPEPIRSRTKSFPVKIEEVGDKYRVSYETSISNKYGAGVGKRLYVYEIPRAIEIDERGFEVLGLLQGEMSKTNRGILTFANSEPQIINAVMDWFREQFHIPHEEWNWYVRLNVPEPDDADWRMYYEQQLVSYWYQKTRIGYYKRYKRATSYLKVSKHKQPQNFGTLMIERGNPVFIQTVQNLVRWVTKTMLERSNTEIAAYMRGVIAAESCVNFKLKSGHRRVFITATVEQERAIFRECLHKLGISTQDCKPLKDIVISRRENIEKLRDLNLMSGSREKNARFKEMLASYQH